jgi:alanyl aminopeptidase
MNGRILFLATMALSLCLGGCGKHAKKDDAAHRQTLIAPEAVPLGPLPRVVVPTHYRLAFTIDPAKDRFTGHDEIDVTFTKPRRMLFLHGLDITVSGVGVRLPSGRTIAAHYDQVDRSGVVRLVFVDEVPAGPATLTFDYDAPFAGGLSGLYKVVNKGIPYAFTQFESIDARRAFPSFDEPGFKTPFDVTVTAPAADSVIANTPEASRTPAPNGMMRIAFQPTKPLPTYLVALAVGPLDVVDGGDIPANQYRDHPIHLRGVTAKGNGARIRYALSLTPSIVTALENYFQIAYPFQKLDILAVPDFAAGAMENAGAITFRERLLLDADASMEQKRASLVVQAHELTHQWFGDLVTPKWWDDTWLNESFANWMENKASSAVLPQEEFDRETLNSGIDVMDLDELPSARQIHQPVNGPDDIDNAFDRITYDKGASVLAMFESYVGEDAWRAGIHTYLTKFASGNASAQDFIGTIASATGRPEIVASFNSFIDQPGIPLLSLTAQCIAGKTSLGVAQSMYVQIGRTAPDRLWGVPICATAGASPKMCRLVDTATADLPLSTKCSDTVMPNAQGKGYYRFALDEKGWQTLLKTAPKLSPADQLALFANINAALHADKASAADFFDAIRVMAPTAHWELLNQMAVALHAFHEKILAPDDLPAYRAFVAKTFDARLKVLRLSEKPNEAPADTLAREKLARLMVEEARDPQVMGALAVAARAYVASSGTNLSGMAPDVVPYALRAGIIVQGAPFGDALIGLFQSSNSEYLRRNIVYAFAGSDDPAVVRKILAIALTKIRTGELRYLSQYMVPENVARAALWDWVKTSYTGLIARVSPQGMSRSVGVLSEACDVGARSDLDAFFGPKTKDLEGTARPLALAEEQIDRCVAFKAAKGAEMTAALKALK